MYPYWRYAWWNIAVSRYGRYGCIVVYVCVVVAKKGKEKVRLPLDKVASRQYTYG